MDNKSNEGINKLAQTLQGRMKSLDDKPPILDFGVIQDDMSLLTNKFPLPIPQKDYMVCRSVQWGAVGDIFYKTQASGKSNSGEHSHDGGGHTHPDAGYNTHIHTKSAEGEQHVHDTLVGEKFRWLQPGDRVLVAWVGDDACVVDLIYPATRIGRDADGYDK
ncbi:MAG: hypothetical protein LBQ15_07230 [Clostridium sp.]|jgi:hypothetical protein|nr:hypothetical protein [Clostridium sp.]